MKKIICFVASLAICASSGVWAQALGYNNNRFAISADGNNADDFKDKWPRADPDDWGATPVTMAIIAKTKLADKMVHYSYNNFVEANVGPADENIMDIVAQSGIKRFRFDESRFFDASTHFEQAKASLKAEMAKSTAADPLYFIHMGPAEFFYQCVKECVDEGKAEAMAHVYVISHSGYNDNHLRRPYHHTMEQAIEYSGGRIKYKRIKDQNAKWDVNKLWNSGKDFSVWHWMRDSKDPNIKWLYDCLCLHPLKVADASDAGMLYYLLLGDEDGSPEKFRKFLGEEIVPNSFVKVQEIETDSKNLLVFEGQKNEIKAEVFPELASDKRVEWSSSKERIATVENGVVRGLKKGKATITARSMDGGKEAKVEVEVQKLPSDHEKVSLSAMKDFQTLEVDGFAPAYKDKARGAIAINAAKYKDEFAASNIVFSGKTGLYDIVLKVQRELDGESKYRIRVAGRLVGEFKNKRTKVDYEAAQFVAKAISVRAGDLIQIESNSHSNFIVPEGEAFAFSRGRWKGLEFIPSKIN